MSTTPNPLPQDPSQAAQPDAADAQQPNDAQAPPEQDADEILSESGSQNLARSFSKLNECLIELADGLAVKRRATIPHVDGQSMAEHLQTVGTVLADAGGLTGNQILASHSQHGASGGSTVAFPADKLRTTIITKDNKDAIAAIAACKSFVSKVKSLIGETPEIKQAQSQLALVGKHNGEAMTVADLIVALINIPVPVIQAIGRAHSDVHPDGPAPHLRAPHRQ